MKRDLKHFIWECEVCQKKLGLEHLPIGLLQPLQFHYRFGLIYLWEGLPLSNGHFVFLVVVDRMSKYAHFTYLAHPYTASKVAQIFVNNIIKLHGMPTSIVSDHDPTFTSAVWKELFRMQATTLKMSTNYHPQTDGQTEIVNKSLENYLRCFAHDRPK